MAKLQYATWQLPTLLSQLHFHLSLIKSRWKEENGEKKRDRQEYVKVTYYFNVIELEQLALDISRGLCFSLPHCRWDTMVYVLADQRQVKFSQNNIETSK